MRYALTLLLLSAFCRPASAEVAGVAALAFSTFQLDNGLRVIIHENKRSRKVFTKVWYEVGSRDEPPGFSGFAHLLEHVAAFNTTENVSVKEQKETQLAAGGSSNASTFFDRTDYYLEGDHRYLERFLRILADQMGFLNGMISAEVYREETKHVIEELKQSENNPGGGVLEQLLRNVFPESHPYAHTPIGSQKDLKARSADDARDFHARYYWPNNAILVIVGNVDAAAAKAMAQRWFGPLKRGPDVLKPAAVPGPSPVSRSVHYDSKIRTESLLMAWRIPGKGQPGYGELALFAELLGGGSTSRLYDALVVRRPVLTEVSAGLFGHQLDGLFLIEGTPAEGVALEQAEEAVVAEINAMLAEKMDAQRLEAIARGGRIAAFVASQSNATVAALAAESWAYTRTVDPFYSLNDLVKAAGDPARVASVARRYLKRPDTVMSIRPTPKTEPPLP